MTSREIAEHTGKRHADVLEAIRSMEPAWVKVGQRNFPLMFSITHLPNGGERKDPYYELSKKECLYIATKFNDEARAKLVLRWEELETQNRIDFTNPATVLQLAQNWAQEQERRIAAERERENLRIANDLQARELKEAAPKVEYCNEVLKSESLITTTVIAKELGMSAPSLNRLLHSCGIIYKSGKTWVLYHRYQNKEYTDTRTHSFVDNHGVQRTEIHTYWTEKGRMFIHSFVKQRVNNGKVGVL